MSDVPPNTIGGISDKAAVAALPEMHKSNYLRQHFANGLKRRIPVAMLGPHPSNRASVFPNSLRVRSLACEIICIGFHQEEADFEGVCVKEYSAEQQKDMKGYTSFGQNCADKARGCVKGLFDRSGGDIFYGTLSHSHLAIILRAIEDGAKWEVPTDDLTAEQINILKQKGLLENETGLLMMSAVADRDEVARKLVKEGMLFEVLDANIMKEAGACATIAQAINRPQAFAMRMSELEALKVLSSEINNAKEQRGSAAVTYEGVMQIATARLGPWASDPALVDFFNFILNLGADGGPHIKDLITFVETYVNSSSRTLRLAAFGLVGQLKTEFPRVKVAIIMRCYRLPPKNACRSLGAPGWCTDPSPSWKRPALETQLRLMQDVLHAHHVTLRSNIAKLMTGEAVELFLTNISIQCARSMEVVSKMPTPTTTSAQEALLEACHTAYAISFEKEAAVGLMADMKALHGWFDFDKLPPQTASDKNAAHLQDQEAEAALNPQVISFNEVTGQPENRQMSATAKEKTEEWLPLPMAEWLDQKCTKEKGTQQAFMGAVLQVLQNKHQLACDQYTANLAAGDAMCAASKLLVILLRSTTSNKVKVCARAAVAAGKLVLWPCVPNQSKVLTASSHPDKVHVQVWAKDTEGSVKTSFYVHPEFAVPDAKTCSEVQRTDPAQEQWKWTGKESLHPIWALTKLTPEELGKRNFSLAESGRTRFNVAFEDREVNLVVCGRIITVRVPVVVNTDDLEAGEELVMEVQVGKKKTATEKDWRDSLKKKSKTKPPQQQQPKSDFNAAGRQDI